MPFAVEILNPAGVDDQLGNDVGRSAPVDQAPSALEQIEQGHEDPLAIFGRGPGLPFGRDTGVPELWKAAAARMLVIATGVDQERTSVQIHADVDDVLWINADDLVA